MIALRAGSPIAQKVQAAGAQSEKNGPKINTHKIEMGAEFIYIKLKGGFGLHLVKFNK